MAFRFIRASILLTLVIGISLSVAPAPVHAAVPASLPADVHTFIFYVDPALLTDMDFARTVLSRYVADMNTILGKNTRLQLVFDPATGIVPTKTKPQSDSAASPLPTDGFPIWAHVIQTTLPYSYGGYAGVDRTGAGVLAGLRWTRLYDPENLVGTEVWDYGTQINNMLHELAHVFGAGIGEYYSLTRVADTTTLEPLMDIDLNGQADSYWAAKSDFWTDPLLRITRVGSRAEYLQQVTFADLTAAVFNGGYRNGVPVAGGYTVRVLDRGSSPVAGAQVRVWSVQASQPFSAQALFEGQTDESGQLAVDWGGSGGPHSAGNMLRLIKVYKDGVPFTQPRYVSVFDLEMASVLDQQAELTVTMPAAEWSATFLSLPADDGWVLESARRSRQGGSTNSTGSVSRLGRDAANRRYRAVLAFDTADLPDNAVVTGVSLRIRRHDLVGPNPFAGSRRLVVDADVPFIGTEAGLQEMDFQDGVAQPFLAAFQEKAVQGWYTADLGAAASGIINVMSSTQFRLRFTSRPRTGPSYLEFYSGDAADQNQPRLIVNYYLQ